MDPFDYALAWTVYLIAAAGLTVIGWLLMKKHLWLDLAFLLECLLIALLYTPWYVLPDQEVMAPAFIIFLMDTITIDATAGIRALIPLVMAMLLAMVVTIFLSIGYRIMRRKRSVK